VVADLPAFLTAPSRGAAPVPGAPAIEPVPEAAAAEAPAPKRRGRPPKKLVADLPAGE
jgi:hypothetical protein